MNTIDWTMLEEMCGCARPCKMRYKYDPLIGDIPEFRSGVETLYLCENHQPQGIATPVELHDTLKVEMAAMESVKDEIRKEAPDLAKDGAIDVTKVSVFYDVARNLNVDIPSYTEKQKDDLLAAIALTADVAADVEIKKV